MKYNIAIKQLFVILKTDWIFQFLKGNLFSIASYEIIKNLKTSIQDLDYIIDVGANKGQFTKVASHLFPNAIIDSFEPLPELFIKNKNQFNNSKNVSIYNHAFGNETGVIKFNRNGYNHISSILEIDSKNVHYPKNKLEQIEVKIDTFDNFYFDKIFPKKTLLKLDVQGFELEVLKGAMQSIHKVKFIALEINLETLYENQPSFTEVNTYLNKIGFEIYSMLDFNLGKKNKYIEIDVLYKNMNYA